MLAYSATEVAHHAQEPTFWEGISFQTTATICSAHWRCREAYLSDQMLSAQVGVFATTDSSLRKLMAEKFKLWVFSTCTSLIGGSRTCRWQQLHAQRNVDFTGFGRSSRFSIFCDFCSMKGINALEPQQAMPFQCERGRQLQTPVPKPIKKWLENVSKLTFGGHLKLTQGMNTQVTESDFLCHFQTLLRHFYK